MLDPSRVRAISLDLDDTLWPIWPTIERAERVLNAWLQQRAPATAELFADAQRRLALREQFVQSRPDVAHDLSTVRRETIRLALSHANDNPALAEEAFEVFFAERHQVELYDDALPSLRWLAQRYPLVALSNGNADVVRVGLSGVFTASVSATTFGKAKPSPEIFDAAAQAVGVSSAEVLHVGDDAHLDVLGALGAGMQAVWVNRTAHPWSHAVKPHGTVASLTELCDLLA